MLTQVIHGLFVFCISQHTYLWMLPSRAPIKRDNIFHSFACHHSTQKEDSHNIVVIAEQNDRIYTRIAL